MAAVREHVREFASVGGSTRDLQWGDKCPLCDPMVDLSDEKEGTERSRAKVKERRAKIKELNPFSTAKHFLGQITWN